MAQIKIGIARGKCLTIDSMKKMEYIYKSKNLTLEMKLRTFNAFSGSAFLYNSEFWSMTATAEKKIDSFHRRMLRQAIVHVRWPKKISNANLYRNTKVEPWSKTINRRRLNWLGHLADANRYSSKNSSERSPSTYNKEGKSTDNIWLKTIEKDLAHTIEIDIYHCSAGETTSRLESLTLDRNTWKSTVKNMERISRNEWMMMMATIATFSTI